MQQQEQTSVQQYRMAQRKFLCYACNNEFTKMINIGSNSQIECSGCGSDFVEEMRSVQANPVQSHQSEVQNQPE